MFLQFRANLLEFAIRLRQFLLQFLNVLGQTNARYDILALGIHQVIPFDMLFSGRRIARHGHARGTVIAHVAKNHGTDIHGGTQIMANTGGIAIIDCTFAVPAFKDRFGCQFQLLNRIGWKILFRMRFINTLEFFSNYLPVFCRQIGIGFHAGLFPGLCEDFFKRLIRDVHHDTTEHLDKSPVKIIHKTIISG